MSISEDQQAQQRAARALPWDKPVTRRDLLKFGGLLGFGAVGASMLAACSPAADLAAPVALTASIPPAEAKYVVMVIVDGCRSDYLTYGPLPNINSMKARGTFYRNAWAGIMESITPACHASLG